MELKDIVYNELKNIQILSEVENLYDLLTNTQDSKNGDITLPCFSLAKVFRKSPMDIGNSIIDNINKDVFEKVENVNGYVNFYLNKKKTFELIYNNLNNYIPTNVGQGKTVFIDFSSLNLAKYMHIGHLSTTVIGSVIANTYEYLGYKVIRLNYVGDYGTPFGKMITAIKRWGNLEQVEKQGVDYVQGLYVKFNAEADNDDSLMEEAREWFVKIENKDPEALKYYNKIISVSISEAKRLCDILNISFDSWIGEAYYSDKMEPVLQELEDKKLLVSSEGAKIVDLEKYNLGACLLVKSDGSSLYSTRDLTTAIDRYNRYQFDLGLYVTCVAQKLHFDRWFKVLDLMGKDYAKNLKHIAYGTYSLPSGKIGSRFGKQALVKDMLEVSIEKAKEIVSTRGTKVDDIDTLASQIGIGAVKFGVLKTERIKDCVWDLESSLNFDGETSPYMQYTGARCNSIIAKAEKLEMTGSINDVDNVDTWELIKYLNNFDKTVVSSAKDFEPCYISRYLLNLCSLFNKFYNNHRIIDNDKVNKYRLDIVKIVRDTLKSGLKLLGIDMPNAM